MVGRIHEDIAMEFGSNVADAFMSFFMEFVPIISDIRRIIKVYNTWDDTSAKLRNVAFSVKQDALPIHEELFVEAGIQRAL